MDGKQGRYAERATLYIYIYTSLFPRFGGPGGGKFEKGREKEFFCLGGGIRKEKKILKS